LEILGGYLLEFWEVFHWIVGEGYIPAGQKYGVCQKIDVKILTRVKKLSVY